MAFKRKQDTGGGDIFKFETVGNTLTGVYLGGIEVEGKYGPQIKHTFKTKEGTKVVYGSTHVNNLLDGERPGQLMCLTYVGDKRTKKGGNPMKEFTLDIDDAYEATDEELEFASNLADGSDEERYVDDAPTAPAKPPVKAGAPSESARARVDALLKNNRRAG